MFDVFNMYQSTYEREVNVDPTFPNTIVNFIKKIKNAKAPLISRLYKIHKDVSYGDLI